MAEGAVAACREVGCWQGMPAIISCGVDALGAGPALRTLGALCTLTLCPHQAATHTRRCVRGPQRGGHGRRRVQIARATGPPTAARADVGPRAEVMRYSAQRAYRFTWVLDSLWIPNMGVSGWW